MVNDEDFVMGYAVGFNDGVGSGGSKEPFSEIVIEKNYFFGDSSYGIATLDFKKSRCYRQNNISSWSVKDSDGQYHIIWGPVSDWTYLWAYALTKNGKIIGLWTQNISFSTESEAWSYATGEWAKTSEIKHDFGKCVIVQSGTESEQTFKMSIDVDGKARTQQIATRTLGSSGWTVSMYTPGAPYFMDNAEYAAWLKALIENGITIEEVS